jgi:hypothetical protein
MLLNTAAANNLQLRYTKFRTKKFLCVLETELLTAMLLDIPVFQDVMLCRLVNSYRRFELSLIRLGLVFLKLEAIQFSETSGTVSLATQRNIPEDLSFRLCYCFASSGVICCLY